MTSRFTSRLEISPRPSLDATLKLLTTAQLPTEDLTAAHCENFFYAGPPHSPSGLVGLEVLGDVALLRSLVVEPERRGNGDASALLEHAEKHARSNGVRAVYLLTTTAESFFAKHGYQRVSRDAAPASIRTTREFADICPSSSAFMMRLLN
jgi:amino-acid N-acetyltransferase